MSAFSISKCKYREARERVVGKSREVKKQNVFFIKIIFLLNLIPEDLETQFMFGTFYSL
jgi:hypothetical protein